MKTAAILTKWLAAMSILLLSTNSIADTQQGEIVGATKHDMPSWFKESFLDISEDASEAGDENKHVMLFFQRDDCPYCERMLRESIDAEPLRSFIQEHFDVIAINTKGDREIAFDENTIVTEKELKEKLKVKHTPNLYFLNHQNDAVARLNGYRSPARMKHLLEYVQTKSYLKTSLPDYMAEHVTKGAYKLRENDLFQPLDDLSKVKGPLAVIFEDSSCDECDYLHDRLLMHPDIQQEIKAFTVVRLNTDSDKKITNTDGETMTPAQWANTLKMTYRPGIIMYVDGKQMEHINGTLYPYHFRETLRYIGRGMHKTMTRKEYMSARKEELLSSGENIDYSE
uniref:Thioredoxin SoxW n=1 Tax=uncultured Thiotrichaceae bacterium TaxID=298394 RepID=A0A6S6TIU6_9GAMM|nr:MAG: thioredoxin SoxW [uncultured Thiotrichaceae bacterium]